MIAGDFEGDVVVEDLVAERPLGHGRHPAVEPPTRVRRPIDDLGHERQVIGRVHPARVKPRPFQTHFKGSRPGVELLGLLQPQFVIAHRDFDRNHEPELAHFDAADGIDRLVDRAHQEVRARRSRCRDDAAGLFVDQFGDPEQRPPDIGARDEHELEECPRWILLVQHDLEALMEAVIAADQRLAQKPEAQGLGARIFECEEAGFLVIGKRRQEFACFRMSIGPPPIHGATVPVRKAPRSSGRP